MDISTTILGVAAFVFFTLYLRSQSELRNARRKIEKHEGHLNSADARYGRLVEVNRKLRARPPGADVMHLIAGLEPVVIYHLFERDRDAPPSTRAIKSRYVTTDVDEAMREKVRLGCQLTVFEGFRAPNGDLFYNPRIRKVGE